MKSKNSNKQKNNHNGSPKISRGFIRISKIPEENVINLKEMMLKKEIEELQKRLGKKSILEKSDKKFYIKIKDGLASIYKKRGEIFKQLKFKTPTIQKAQIKVIKTNNNLVEKLEPIKQNKRNEEKTEKNEKPVTTEITETTETTEFTEPQKAQPVIQVTTKPTEKKEIGTEGRTKNIFSKLSKLRWQKAIISFIVVCLLLVLPIFIFTFYGKFTKAKGEVLGESYSAIQYLKNASDNISQYDFQTAGENFDKATEKFLTAQDELNKVTGALLGILKILPNKVKSAQYLLEAGKNISAAGDYLSKTIAQLEKLAKTTNLEKVEKNINLTDSLVVIIENIKPAQNEILSALDNLKKVNSKDLPDEYTGIIEKIQNSIPKLEEDFANLSSLSEVLLNVFGNDSQKRYLILFENNHEMRPTGGFIGSLALVDIYKGKIENLEVPGGGSYDVAGQLKEKLIAPKPLQLVNPHWNIQDANWFPDYPTSAQKIIWFFERGGGASVDGVIALTPTIIEDLLKITGPIDMTENYNITVTADNFVNTAQKYAEIEYNKEENKPKKFVADLLPIILNRLIVLDTEKLLSILSTFNKSLTEKQLLLYFTNSEDEKKIIDFGWAGEVKNTNKDYLAIINTNIAGGKTDAVIEQLIDHQAEVQSDGGIIDTVKLTRIHHGNKSDQWEGIRNVDYIRFYVPQGSQLMEVSGFEEISNSRYHLPDQDAVNDPFLDEIEKNVIIDEKSGTRISNEFNKTVFGNWVSVGPGESATITIKYKLPFNLDFSGLFNKSDSYSILIQKQAGDLNTNLTSKIIFPSDLIIYWEYPELNKGVNFAQYNTMLNTDKYWAVVLKK